MCWAPERGHPIWCVCVLNCIADSSVTVQLARAEPIAALDPSSKEWGTLRHIELGVETVGEVDQVGSAGQSSYQSGSDSSSRSTS
jgi:hypothetical protein